MVKNRNPGGRRSSTCKTKKADSHVANSKDLAPLGDPAGSNTPAVSPEFQTSGQGQLGFSDRVYLLASVIFQNNHLQKPPSHILVNYGKEKRLQLPEVKDEVMRRTAYELAFSTLKYQSLLEDIMIDSCFYLTQPMPDDQMSLVAVMLYDFQDRKFIPRKRQGEEEIIQEVREVENYLLGFKTKLAASLARCRIKHGLLSIECILPENVKIKQERSSSLPLYAWVNTQRSSLKEVQHVLRSAAFSQVKSVGQLEGQTFCQDSHCGDVLVLPAQLKAQLYSTKLLNDNKLIIQDKSCSLGPNAVCSLLPEEGDALMVGCFSGLTVSHTASLISEKHKGNSNYHPTVYVCVSDRTSAQREELQQAVTAMGCKNVKLIPEDFQSLHSGDKRLQRMRVILLTPKCSVSAVSNPVEFLLQENGDTDLLQDLSQGVVARSKLEALVAQQRKDIDHALKFPKVLAVIYSTCSTYQEENEEVVSKALEQANIQSEQEGEPKQAKFRLGSYLSRLPDDAEGPEKTDPFFVLEPSKESNGCFLAVLIREPELQVKEEPQEVLARANAKGILDRIGSNNQRTRKEQRGRANGMTKTTHAHTPQPHLSDSNQSKNQETKGSVSATSCGQQEVTKRRWSLQGKAKGLRSQASKNTWSGSFSFSKQESTSSPKVENGEPKKTITPVFNIATSKSSLHPAPPPATPLTPVVRPRRAHQEVLRPVVLAFPPAHFPDYFPPQHSRTGFSSSFNYDKRRSPAAAEPLSGTRLSKGAMVKPWPVF